MFVVSLVVFRCSAQISSSSVWFKSFGFERNGSYSFNFASSISSEKIIIVSTSKEYKSVPKSSLTSSYFCSPEKYNTFSNFHVFDMKNNSEYSWNGTVNTADTYYAIVTTCSNENAQYNLILLLRNPSTFLDIRWLKAFFTKPLILSLMTILSCLTLTNIFNHYALRIKIHVSISILLLLTVSSYTISYYKLIELDKSDYNGILNILSIVFDSSQQFFLISTIVLISKGYCIVVEDLKLDDYMKSSLFCLTYVIIVQAIQYMEGALWIPLLYLLLLCSLYLLAKEIISSIEYTFLSIIGHLMLITNQNIDSSSTPIFIQYKKYSMFRISIIIYAGLNLILIVSPSAFEFDYWISDLFRQTIDFLIILVLCWLLRLDGNNPEKYLSLSVPNRKEVLISDIIDLDIYSTQISSGRHLWIEGMDLPPQPFLVNTKSLKEMEDIE